MILYIKGLLNKKKFLKIGIIMLFLIIVIFSLTYMQSYLKEKENIEKNKEVYRTISFTTNKLDEEDITNNYEIEDLEVENNTYIVVFKTYLGKDKFLEDNEEYLSNVEVYLSTSEEDSINYLLVLNISIYVSLIVLMLLIILFSIDYINTIKKELSLYMVLGFNKSISILSVLFVLFILLFIEFVFIFFIFYIININYLKLSIDVINFIKIFFLIVISLIVVFGYGLVDNKML